LSDFKRVLASFCLFLAALLGGAAPLFAQIPSVLEEVRLVTEDARQASFILRFSPREPDVAPLNNNPSRPTLLMRATLRAPRVATTGSYRGIVRTTRFEVGDGNLLMHFDSNAPAKVTVERVGSQAIKVTVDRVGEAEATGIQPIGSSSDVVVPASDLAAAPNLYNEGDSYELVFLKYADVSEIIGLLVEGQTIEPNNVFIRREPGFGSPGSTSQNNYNNSTQAQANPKEDRPLGQSFGGLAIDRRLNAIWITGSPDRIERIKQQIALIDVPVDSVILETQFVELSELGARNLGIDLNNSAGQIGVATLTTGSNLPFGTDPNRILPSGALQAAI
jgi:general secretion pathway protein D